ncbi:PQQ-like beta-propeller repeat protein, partial [bacterium]|nr:PQQ-like beta-propeller repeat protein [bacterium]
MSRAFDKSGEFELQITGDRMRIYQVEESGSGVEMPFDSKSGAISGSHHERVSPHCSPDIHARHKLHRSQVQEVAATGESARNDVLNRSLSSIARHRIPLSSGEPDFIFIAIMKSLFSASLLLVLLSVTAIADDWGQWFGPQRDGVWRETGILEKFPSGGPKVLWRTPVNRGYAGPSVVGDRVFVMDRKALNTAEAKAKGARTGNKQGNERLLCLDAATGKVIWEKTYDCPYTMSYSAGPRVTPLVDGDRVYTLGGEGNLICRSAEDGAEKWSHDFKKLFAVKTQTWGFASSPLVYEDLLICLGSGEGSTAVAFHKVTGKEVWRSVSAKHPGYCPPRIVKHAGRDLLPILRHDQRLVIAMGKLRRGIDERPNNRGNIPYLSPVGEIRSKGNSASSDLVTHHTESGLASSVIDIRFERRNLLDGFHIGGNPKLRREKVTLRQRNRIRIIDVFLQKLCNRDLILFAAKFLILLKTLHESQIPLSLLVGITEPVCIGQFAESDRVNILRDHAIRQIRQSFGRPQSPRENLLPFVPLSRIRLQRLHQLHVNLVLVIITNRTECFKIPSILAIVSSNEL